MENGGAIDCRPDDLPWTREKIISTIQTFHLEQVPLNFKHINTNYTDLRKKAEEIFGSWGNAVVSAGINYEEVKKNKGRAKPLLGDDGIFYFSQIEGSIANKLHKLKNDGKILYYKPQADLFPYKNWVCDFHIILPNNVSLLIEVDNGRKEELQEKLELYDKIKILYHKVLSPNNIENIVERYTSWYSIPIINSVITAHKNPDGDALSSARAIYNFLESNGKKVALRFVGDIPKNLEWVIDGAEIVKKIPDWTENIVVLDCAIDRIGWEIPGGLSVYNIDHHASRIKDNDPDNDIHVIPSCSTASMLFNFFGIRDDILVVGVYTDTLFTKNLVEVMNFLFSLNVDEQKINEYISKINANPDKKLWKMISDSEIHRCRNGFIIVETEENIPDIIESFMQILSKMSESVCLIYGDYNVKLRTSNSSIDLSEIAQQFSGGGHPFASMCNIKGRVSEFKSKIVSFEVSKNQGEKDEQERKSS